MIILILIELLICMVSSSNHLSHGGQHHNQKISATKKHFKSNNAVDFGANTALYARQSKLPTLCSYKLLRN